ncbi:MAG: HAD-IA family hydrolase [Acidobacteria bacterium]|nr:HAD-IA family hydrolase [Acidobacteriota bacterium]MDA1236824.1 HAD-IA family hydrolase [Acidobacteriota bacterium]
MLSQPKAVLFDFDYTLADSSSAVVDCCNGALASLGLRPATEDDIRRTIGLSIPDTLARLAGEEHRHREQEFRTHWRKRSDVIMVEQTYLYDEAHTAVAALREWGVAAGIVSTKWRQRIVDVLERESLVDGFSVIVGGDDVAENKPDPEGLLIATRLLGTAPAEVIYVGDSTTDAKAAERAGMRFVAVLSGVTEAHEFDEFAPLRVLPHVGEIGNCLIEAR